MADCITCIPSAPPPGPEPGTHQALDGKHGPEMFHHDLQLRPVVDVLGYQPAG